jgi:hypothetical protein
VSVPFSTKLFLVTVTFAYQPTNVVHTRTHARTRKIHARTRKIHAHPPNAHATLSRICEKIHSDRT